LGRNLSNCYQGIKTLLLDTSSVQDECKDIRDLVDENPRLAKDTSSELKKRVEDLSRDLNAGSNQLKVQQGDLRRVSQMVAVLQTSKNSYLSDFSYSRE